MSGEPVRLQKFLSQAGLASRRAAEQLIRDGKVRVNGSVVTELGTKVDAQRDRIEVDGKRIRAARTVWLALYKPAGYVTTRSDPEGRPTVYDLLPAQYAGLFHVGRLDVNSEGLILLTNEGDVANRLMHPRYEVDRVYEVQVTGGFGVADAERMRAGVQLEDGVARAHAVDFLGTPRGDRIRVKVTMREGRNREVRRLFEALGFRVVRLLRRRYGPVRLTGLAPGGFRKLTREERAALERGESGERAQPSRPGPAGAGARPRARKHAQKPRIRETPGKPGRAASPRKRSATKSKKN